MKTKSEVIVEAVRVVNSYHPNKENSLRREATLKATFAHLCRDIPENCPNDSARTIFNYIHNALALKR